jgi:hypothetical protein
LEYIWILATGNPAVHAEILQTMKRIVPMNQIIDMYAFMIADRRFQKVHMPSIYNFGRAVY